MSDGLSAIIPSDERPLFRKFFARWLRRNLAKKFHAIRLQQGSVAVLEDAASHDGPVIVLGNHSSWWDPLVGCWVHDHWFIGRPSITPMDRSQLQKFSFFRKLGVFGIDPDNAGGLRALCNFVATRFAANRRTVLMMTPQGEFVDVRRPVVIRPGAGVLAANHPEACVLVVNVEYAFWTDQRPEVFLRVERVFAPKIAGDSRAWRSAIELAMNRNAAILAEAVMGRDQASFTNMFGGSETRIHLVYDLMLKLTGRSNSIETAHRSESRSS